MPKKDSDDYNISETGNWNVAADYSRLKIMKPLYLADLYETIATFGHIDFMDELSIDVNVDTLKIKGFRRLVKTLILVISNSQFAIKKGSQDNLKKYKEDLEKIYKIIPALSKYKVDQRNKTRLLVLDNERYDKALELVSDIKASINEPLNEADLIFTSKEDFDPKAFKKSIFDAATQRG